jgi:DNA-binding transcriptional LysR family regulator
LRRLIENIRLVIVNHNLVFTWCKDARTPEAVMTHPISPIMLSYRTFHPEVRFKNLSAEHRISLEKGEADIAFRATDGDLGGNTLISLRLPSITCLQA